MPQQADALLGENNPGVIFGHQIRDPQSATLTGTVVGGFINIRSSTGAITRYRNASTTKAFTASKDTYVYVSSAGAIGYLEVANGAAKPSQATLEATGGVGAQMIAKVVTDGSRITDGGVTDLRQFAGADLHEASFTTSFITAEQGAQYWVAPCPVWFLYAQSSVQVALAGTDAGTVTFALGVNDKYTAVTNGVITIPLSSAIGTRVDTVPSDVMFVDAGQSLRFTTAKTTAGGRAITQIVYARVSRGRKG